MPIEYSQECARFCGHCSVEEAEQFLEWALVHPDGAVDLSAVDHLHTALLQLLLQLKPTVIGLPPDRVLRSFINGKDNSEAGGS